MRERIRVGGLVLERLAQRKLHMQPVLVAQIAARRRRAQGRDIGGGELDGFEVGETPIGLAQRRLQRNGTTVGGNALLSAAGRLERMAVAHP